MQPLKLELPREFYDAAALKEHCDSFVAWNDAGPVAVIDSADDAAWESLNEALRQTLGKAIHSEND